MAEHLTPLERQLLDALRTFVENPSIVAGLPEAAAQARRAIKRAEMKQSFAEKHSNHANGAA